MTEAELAVMTLAQAILEVLIDGDKSNIPNAMKTVNKAMVKAFGKAAEGFRMEVSELGSDPDKWLREKSPQK